MKTIKKISNLGALKFRSTLLLLVLLFILPSPSMTQTRDPDKIYKVAILPFLIYSRENLDYLREGVYDILSSRITTGGRVVIVQRSMVERALFEERLMRLDEDVAKRIGRRVGADYIVLGSLTKTGDDVRLDAHLIGITEESPPLNTYAQANSIGDVMVKIGNFAREIGDRMGWAPSEPEPRDPVIITNSYAVDKGRYGTIWKIYIEAEATEAEIGGFAAKVEQVGQGYYPIYYVPLKSPYRRYLKGYLQWNTFSSKTTLLKEGTQVTLKISAIDKAGNRSKEVVFPFSFESGVKDQVKLPAPFDQGDLPRLGYIGIDLINPERGR